MSRPAGVVAVMGQIARLTILGLLRSLGVGAVLMCTGCASTTLTPLHESPVALPGDEQKLWQSADALAAEIGSAGALVEDADLLGYLESLTDRLLGPRSATLPRPVSVAVLLSSDTNAFMLANGQAYVTIGLLARTETESQVATILGHEISHYLNRHSLKSTRTAANERLKREVLSILAAGIGGAVGGVAVGQSLGEFASSAVEQWQVAALSGYSQTLEYEADDAGFQMLVEAGFDARQAPGVFAHLMAQMVEDGVREPYFYATHPRLADRLARYEGLASGLDVPSAPAPQDVDPYVPLRAKVLMRDASLNIALRRLDRADRELQTVEVLGGRNGRTAFLLGEVERLRSPAGTTPRALALFLEAIGFPDAPEEAWREAGLALQHTRRDDALRYLNEYLARSPNAVDAPLIRRIIASGG